jgi:DNA-binding CsgD family transcriptional regulator
MSIVSPLPNSSDNVLVRFVVDGASCVIVPRARTDAARCIGGFELSGQRYAILKIDEDKGEEDALSRLTPRELEIALWVAAGQEMKTVARRLRISFHTVRVHIGRIYAKLNLHKQTELAVLISTRYGTPDLPTRSSKRETAKVPPMIFGILPFAQALFV